MLLPRLYPILDPIASPMPMPVLCREELASAGCTLLQYRNKSGNARQMLEDAAN